MISPNLSDLTYYSDLEIMPIQAYSSVFIFKYSHDRLIFHLSHSIDINFAIIFCIALLHILFHMDKNIYLKIVFSFIHLSIINRLIKSI